MFFGYALAVCNQVRRDLTGRIYTIDGLRSKRVARHVCERRFIRILRNG